MSTAQAIANSLISSNLLSSNGECANLVDATNSVAMAAVKIATAITPNAAAGHDAQGGSVESLTEAVMGLTAALSSIAASIENVALAIENRK